MSPYTSIVCSNGYAIEGQKILDACEKALEAIEKELPEEARFFEVYVQILDTCKEVLQGKKIVL